MSGLVDRALAQAGRESQAAWVLDNLDTPDVIRTWHPDGLGNEFIDLHGLNAYADALGKRGVRVRQVRGHFDGRPGEAGSAMARKAFLIVEALNRKLPDAPIDAAVILWHIDQQQGERSDGVRAARNDAQRWATFQFQIICGFPDPEREAWVLAGFDPCNDAERRVLEDLHRELGFSPALHAVRLRDKAGGAPRNIKRVLGMLTGDDAGREERCWTEPPLATLRSRGSANGLAAFLDELQAVLPDLLSLGSRTTQGEVMKAGEV